jgi:hypothetical protein
MNDEVRVQDVVVITDSRCTLHIDCFDYNMTYCMLIPHPLLALAALLCSAGPCAGAWQEGVVRVSGVMFRTAKSFALAASLTRRAMVVPTRRVLKKRDANAKAAKRYRKRLSGSSVPKFKRGL